jgi:protein TonB
VNDAPVPDVIYRPGADVKPAVVIQRVDPLYPRLAIAARMSGTVVIHCVIDKSGNIREPQVMSSTFTAFNQPAIDAVQQWRFSPGTMRGKPVDTYFELTVRFSMR